jgi:hypothetical protein
LLNLKQTPRRVIAACRQISLEGVIPNKHSFNALAAQIKLSTAELAEIDAIGPIVTNHLDDNQIMWN